MIPLFGLYFILGAVIGSFLNVCIYRLPLNKSIVSPPSACGSCGHRLNFIDMIPILGYIFFGGKCRYCGEKYSIRYMLVELLTACLFVLCGYLNYISIPLLLSWVFVSCLVVQTFVDLDHQILLDEINLLLIPTGLLYVYYAGNFKDSLYGTLAGGGIMLLIYLISRGGMGAGDVKISFVLGIWLGFQGMLVCLFLAFILGGIIGVILLASKIKSRKDPIPFGPFLCLAAWISFMFWPYLVYFYWSLFI